MQDGCPVWSVERTCEAPKTCSPSTGCACPAPTYGECTGNSCGRRIWDFEGGATEGATVDPPSALTRALFVGRGPGGSWGLAFPIRLDPTSYFFKATLPVCSSGSSADLYGRRFSARVYVEGTLDAMESVVVNVGPELLYLQSLPTNQWVMLTGRFEPPSPEVPLSAYKVVKELGFTFQFNGDGNGGAFAGTVWLDDVRIE